MGHSLHPQGFTPQGVQRVCGPSAQVTCTGPFRALSRLRGTQEGTVDRLGIDPSARHRPGMLLAGVRACLKHGRKRPILLSQKRQRGLNRGPLGRVLWPGIQPDQFFGSHMAGCWHPKRWAAQHGPWAGWAPHAENGTVWFPDTPWEQRQQS